MTTSLPANPSLRHLKVEAKHILQAYRKGDESCCRVLRNLRQFVDHSDAEILKSKIGLHEVQFALALEYGFESWAQLKQHLDAVSAAPEKSALRVNGANAVEVTGNGQNRDSVALSLVAAAQAFGQTLDYADATCRLGNAFGPAIDTEENCTSHMQVEGRLLDRGLALVGEQLGFQVERLEFPDRIGPGDDENAMLSHRQVVAQSVAPLLNEGAVVLVAGGWDVQGGPHGFRHWAYAGLLASVDQEEGLLLGAHPQGHMDNPLVSICQHGMEPHGGRIYAWALRPASETRSDDVATLQLALHRIRGTVTFESDTRDLFGLAAMDFWIELMRRDAGFCAPCWSRRDDDGKPWDAWENAMRMRQSSEHASEFLKGCSVRLDTDARFHLAAAASAYDIIVDLLAGSITREGPESFQTILGDMRLQQGYADSVLTPVREALVDAADHIEMALVRVQAS